MNRIILILILFLSFKGLSQNKFTIKYFESTLEYTKNELSRDSIIPDGVKRVSKRLIKVKKLIDPETGKKSKKIKIPWAIFSGSDAYFNLFYCNDMFSPGLYIKPDVIGRYCVFYTDKESLRLIHSYSPNTYGGGLTGLLINESKKWGKHWIGENQEVIKIFIVDTKTLELIRKKKSYAIWKILNRKNLNEILNLDFSEEKLNNLSLDEVKKLIIEKNNAG